MITSKKLYKDFCKADLNANLNQYENQSGINYKLYNLFNPLRRFLRLLRRTEYFKNCKKGILDRILYIYYLRKFKKMSIKLGYSIPLNVFGPGLSIPHYGTIVVSTAAKVGKNCRLHVCVNIGATSGSTNAPQIGDNVYIGPGAIIFGDIYIADNVTIAANATVNKSVNVPNVIIGGTPAEILKENSLPWWIKNNLSLK